MVTGKPPRPHGLRVTALLTAPSPSSGGPGPAVEPQEQMHSLRRLGFPLDAVDNMRAALRTAKERESWEAQPVTGPGPGGPSAQPGAPAQRSEPLPLPLPGPARPRRTPRVGRRWRTPAEDTYLRGYIVSPLCYDSTSRTLGWDLSAHHPGAVAPLFSLPFYSAVGRNPAPACPIRGHHSRD